jgi:hypothetical protein
MTSGGISSIGVNFFSLVWRFKDDIADKLLLFSRRGVRSGFPLPFGDGIDPSEGSDVGAVDGPLGEDPLPLLVDGSVLSCALSP